MQRIDLRTKIKCERILLATDFSPTAEISIAFGKVMEGYQSAALIAELLAAATCRVLTVC